MSGQPVLRGDWRRLVARALSQGWAVVRTSDHALVLRTPDGATVSIAPHRGGTFAWRAARARLRRHGLR